ncbi:MAG: hypothetical protein JNJ43_14000 [Anaerolineales bacterium]|nr:hypothetical protein [Anaerolineales bacterium]
MLIKTLKWPVLSFLTVALVILVTKIFFPDLKNYFQPSMMGIVWFTFGIWIGYRTAKNGGDFRKAYAAGSFFGVFPAILYILDFGILLENDMSAGILGGVFSLSMVIIGTAIGSGFVLSEN